MSHAASRCLPTPCCPTHPPPCLLNACCRLKLKLKSSVRCHVFYGCCAALRPVWLAAVATRPARTHTHTQAERVCYVCVCVPAPVTAVPHLIEVISALHTPPRLVASVQGGHNLINPHGATSIIISAVLHPSPTSSPAPLSPRPASCCCRYSCYTSIVIQVRSNHFCCVFFLYFHSCSTNFSHPCCPLCLPCPGLACPALAMPAHCFGAAYFLIIVSPPSGRPRHWTAVPTLSVSVNWLSTHKHTQA